VIISKSNGVLERKKANLFTREVWKNSQSILPSKWSHFRRGQETEKRLVEDPMV